MPVEIRLADCPADPGQSNAASADTSQATNACLRPVGVRDGGEIDEIACRSSSNTRADCHRQCQAKIAHTFSEFRTSTLTVEI
jgi:hypothetical protein